MAGKLSLALVKEIGRRPLVNVCVAGEPSSLKPMRRLNQEFLLPCMSLCGASNCV